MGNAVVLVWVIGGIIVLGGICYGIYLLVSNVVVVKKAPPPAGWKEFTYPESGFKAYFPREPVVLKGSVDQVVQGVSMGAPIEVLRTTVEYGAIHHISNPDDAVQVFVVYFRFKPGPDIRSRLEKAFNERSDQTIKNRNGKMRTIRWLGVNADEITTPTGVVRVAFRDSSVYLVMIRAKGDTKAKPEEENGFFDNMELLK
jgi:hypothetical protein